MALNIRRQVKRGANVSTLEPVTSVRYSLRSAATAKNPVELISKTSLKEDCAISKMPIKIGNTDTSMLRPRVPLGDASNKLNIKTKDDVTKKQFAGSGGIQCKTKRASKNALQKEVTDKVAKASTVPVIYEEPQDKGDAQDEGCVSQAFSKTLLNIPDVDSADAGDAEMCSEYVKDIYAYLRSLEVSMAIQPCYLKGREVTGNMRCILIDWLVKVQRQFRLLQETLFMTVWVIDRFLQDNPVPKQTLQLVGVTAMLIASKYEEIYPPSVRDFVQTTDFSYSCVEVHCMERTILKALDFNLGWPPAVHFLRRAVKAGKLSPMAYGMSKYLLELTVLDYECVHHAPSLTAAAAVALSLNVLNDPLHSEWSPVLQHYTGYTEKCLLPVVQRIAWVLESLSEGSMKQLAIKHKYTSARLYGVSDLPETSPRAKLYIQKLSMTHLS